MDKTTPRLNDVSATCLITLFARALESASKSPLLRDPEAEVMADALRPAMLTSDKRLHQRLARSKLTSQMKMYLSLRARHFDTYARDFLERHPDGVVVNLGCGLDTRYHRLRDAGVTAQRLLDLDLPEVIALKRGFLDEAGDRYRMVAQSVLDHT